MAETSPSSLLVAAADRLRDRAAGASSGAWTATDLSRHGPGMSGWNVEHPASDGDGTSPVASVTSLSAEADARWIAALSPAVGPALEQILRDAARQYDVESHIFTPEGMAEKVKERRFAGALALARVLCPDQEVGERG